MDLSLTRETCENILHKLKMQNWTSGLNYFFLSLSLFFFCIFFSKGKSKIFLKYYHAEQLTHLYSNMMNGIITIQSYVRMRFTRSRFKHRQEKYSNVTMIKELYRHPKFSRVCFDIFSIKNKNE
jgi:hypothetical protein